MTLKRSFAAVADGRTRVLILGSLPGERSLAAQEYYAHPGNRFWDLVGAVVDLDLRSLAYAPRLAALNAAGIGLWDVIETGRRDGSLDAAIRDETANDLAGLVAALPDLAAIAFNGQKAATVAARQHLDFGVRTLVLPSSSAVHASLSFAAKRERWLELRNYL